MLFPRYWVIPLSRNRGKLFQMARQTRTAGKIMHLLNHNFEKIQEVEAVFWGYNQSLLSHWVCCWRAHNSHWQIGFLTKLTRPRCNLLTYNNVVSLMSSLYSYQKRRKLTNVSSRSGISLSHIKYCVRAIFNLCPEIDLSIPDPPFRTNAQGVYEFPRGVVGVL